ncbi:C1QL [Mytilus coruscus]|uniref:C1QL n=1 Tax=Mytilus coruscus TaxID=42192 RepID=A0A6J8DQR1_MYTCO|nr:C1QL [Mytilus coruscus]
MHVETLILRLIFISTVTTAAPAITNVAFSVALTGGQILLGTHQVIEYNTVYTNIGNSYDVRHGHFIVPTTGVYLLSYTIMTSTDVEAYIEMVKNGVRISVVYCSTDGYDMNTQTTVQLMQRGDIVWIRHVNGGTPTLNGSGPYNTFTGVFLYDV